MQYKSVMQVSAQQCWVNFETAANVGNLSLIFWRNDLLQKLLRLYILMYNIQRFIPHTNNFHVITQYRLHFQLQQSLLYHFYFNFVLFVHTDHANFDFNRCSTFTKCCFQLSQPLRLPLSGFSQMVGKGPNLFAYSNLNSTFLLKIFFAEQSHDIKNIILYKANCIT